MSVELINRISIKKDGVYVSTHSSNDTALYHSVKINKLTQVYLRGGQKELDKEVINMCFSFCRLKDNHKSILPYKNAINSAINSLSFTKIRKEYDELDNKAFYIANRMDKYKELSKEEANKLYEKVKTDLEKAKDLRNEYVAKIVSE